MPIPNYPLPADLPENWQPNQIVAPNGTDVGETQQHGYNYLMEQVNNAHEAINGLVDYANSVTADSASLTAGSIVLGIPCEATQGLSVKFEAPCASEDVTVGIVIDGVTYEWRDTLGEDIAGIEGLFAAGTMVGIILDREDVIAYLATAAPGKGYVEVEALPETYVPGALYGQILADFEG